MIDKHMIDFDIQFERYQPQQLESCLALFDQNCPAYFAPNERDDYRNFLTDGPTDYFLGYQRQALLATFGLTPSGDITRGRLSWIQVAPAAHGKGVGRQMMQLVTQLAQANGFAELDIAASQHSEAFFNYFGATRVNYVNDGWGPGMHRVNMVLKLTPASG